MTLKRGSSSGVSAYAPTRFRHANFAITFGPPTIIVVAYLLEQGFTARWNLFAPSCRFRWLEWLWWRFGGLTGVSFDVIPAMPPEPISPSPANQVVKLCPKAHSDQADPCR